jgi:lipopolysaccharide/colanic/teichoic acid biosynthesis glycosyltransferase
VIDRAAAAVLLAVTAPLIALLAGCVRRDDGPPALVGLTRIGQHGVPFRMWKLRTLRADRPDGAAAGSPLSGWHDTRATRVGGWLRRWRLDELPQLWNVLRGEMALIGPRPEGAEFVDDRSAWRAVLAARPGIAGPTQVVMHHVEAGLVDGPDGPARYRAELLPAKLAIDRWYLAAASPGLDALVVAAIADRFVFRRAGRFLDKKVAGAVSDFAVLTAGRG